MIDVPHLPNNLTTENLPPLKIAVGGRFSLRRVQQREGAVE
jgi:hypothetical protein